MAALPPYAIRYLRGSGLIPWNATQLESCRVDDDLARSLDIAAVLEEDTAISARQARALGLDRLPDIGRFLPTWEREEAEHGRAIRFVLARQSYTGAEPRAKTIAARRRHVASLPTASLRWLPQTALVFCALGAAGEYLAIVSYTQLANRTDDRACDSLLRSIIRQETRHLAFFLAAARARAEAMSALNALLARRVLASIWEPIGLASIGRDGWQSQCAGWLDEPCYVDRIRRMDRMIDTIPHLRGLDLMASFLTDWDRSRP